jgi:hypothetical protein
MSADAPNIKDGLTKTIDTSQTNDAFDLLSTKNPSTFSFKKNESFSFQQEYGKSYMALFGTSPEKATNAFLASSDKVIAVGGSIMDHLSMEPLFQGGQVSTIVAVRVVDGSRTNIGNTSTSLENNGLLTHNSLAERRPPGLVNAKAFFGFGDGFEIDLTEIRSYGVKYSLPGSKGKSPSVNNYRIYDMYGEPNFGQIMAYEVSVRGWRYGLSGFQQPTTAIYRYGRYGQFRDMLEQRPYTKFFDGNSTLAAAVEVAFVSGTIDYQQAIDYVTASNPSYDPRDSGFWDYEYRSGQPFYDIANID